MNAGPPVPIERVDVPVRLEKRLAALLHDLAEHKRMSVNSCLEEILLHTCEGVGDGVAAQGGCEGEVRSEAQGESKDEGHFEECEAQEIGAEWGQAPFPQSRKWSQSPG